MPQVALVLGGARSGKSAIAERLTATLPAPVTYLATAIADPADDDFLTRIERHRALRPEGWQTVETGADLAAELLATSGTVLVEALTTWVSGHGGAAPDIGALVDALRARDGDTVLVSDEVGLGVHPSTEVGRRYRELLGEVNAAVSEVADQVLLVVAGRVLPLERSPW